MDLIELPNTGGYLRNGLPDVVQCRFEKQLLLHQTLQLCLFRCQLQSAPVQHTFETEMEAGHRAEATALNCASVASWAQKSCESCFRKLSRATRWQMAASSLEFVPPTYAPS